ncbi:hypothetical protein Tco_1130750 [Tanacetum coccineum]
MEIDIELVPGQCNWVSTCHARPQQQEQAYEEEEAVEEDVRGVCKDIPGHESRGLAGPSRNRLFPGREADYPPFGYTRPMPPSYDYCYDTAPDDTN